MNLNPKRLIATAAAVVAVGTGSGVAASNCNPAVGPITVPSSVAADCSSDATTVLNDLLANVPAGSTIALGTNACYQVSSLTVANLKNVTIQGNGATIYQKSYNGGDDPIARLTGNSNLTVSNLTIRGPGTPGGAGSEGGYGIEMGGQGFPVGNSNVTISGVTVKDTAGDGLGILPDLSNCCGINTNITVTGSTFDHIGYHVLTLEGVNGLNFANNTVTESGNFLDMEVDVSVPPQTGTPTGVAQDNVTITDNRFTSAGAGGDWIDELQGACIPLNNLTITNNTLDSTVSPDMELGGGASPTCHASGLTITGNVSTDRAVSPCGGSIAGPYPACALWEVSDFDNVKIELNNLVAYDGDPDYYANTPYSPCVALAGVNTALVAGNTCTGAYQAVMTGGWGMQFNPVDLAVTGLQHCWNIWGATPTTDGSKCS